MLPHRRPNAKRFSQMFLAERRPPGSVTAIKLDRTILPRTNRGAGRRGRGRARETRARGRDAAPARARPLYHLATPHFLPALAPFSKNKKCAKKSAALVPNFSSDLLLELNKHE